MPLLPGVDNATIKHLSWIAHFLGTIIGEALGICEIHVALAIIRSRGTTATSYYEMNFSSR